MLLSVLKRFAWDAYKAPPTMQMTAPMAQEGSGEQGLPWFRYERNQGRQEIIELEESGTTQGNEGLNHPVHTGTKRGRARKLVGSAVCRVPRATGRRICKAAATQASRKAKA